MTVMQSKSLAEDWAGCVAGLAGLEICLGESRDTGVKCTEIVPTLHVYQIQYNHTTTMYKIIIHDVGWNVQNVGWSVQN